MKAIAKAKNDAVMAERNPNKKFLRKNVRMTENMGSPAIKIIIVMRIPWLRNSWTESFIPALFKSDFKSEKYGIIISANG
jgi:hypothetical protein